MRVGVIARCDARGLARQAFEFWRHVPGCSALVVLNPTSEGQGFPQDPGMYPGAQTVTVDTRRWVLHEETVRDWLSTVDVVYAPETLYDWRLAVWAREAGARTVVHVNPEFYRPREHQPDVWWAPTGWRLEHLPPGTKVVPVPVAAEDFAPSSHGSARLRVLHVAGHIAAGDRAGTAIVGEASRHVPEVDIVCRTQDKAVPGQSRRQRWTVEFGGIADHRSLYAGFDVLAYPRKYGGLSLVLNEAMAAGLACVATDVPPNREWPIIPVKHQREGVVHTAAGRLPTFEVAAGQLGLVLDRLDKDRAEVDDWQRRARMWATDHSWAALLPMVLDELEKACA